MCRMEGLASFWVQLSAFPFSAEEQNPFTPFTQGEDFIQNLFFFFFSQHMIKVNQKLSAHDNIL